MDATAGRHVIFAHGELLQLNIQGVNMTVDPAGGPFHLPAPHLGWNATSAPAAAAASCFTPPSAAESELQTLEPPAILALAGADLSRWVLQAEPELVGRLGERVAAYRQERWNAVVRGSNEILVRAHECSQCAALCKFIEEQLDCIQAAPFGVAPDAGAFETSWQYEGDRLALWHARCDLTAARYGEPDQLGRVQSVEQAEQAELAAALTVERHALERVGHAATIALQAAEPAPIGTRLQHVELLVASTTLHGRYPPSTAGTALQPSHETQYILQQAQSRSRIHATHTQTLATQQRLADAVGQLEAAGSSLSPAAQDALPGLQAILQALQHASACYARLMHDLPPADQIPIYPGVQAPSEWLAFVDALRDTTAEIAHAHTQACDLIDGQRLDHHSGMASEPIWQELTTQVLPALRQQLSSLDTQNAQPLPVDHLLRACASYAALAGTVFEGPPAHDIAPNVQITPLVPPWSYAASTSLVGPGFASTSAFEALGLRPPAAPQPPVNETPVDRAVRRAGFTVPVCRPAVVFPVASFAAAWRSDAQFRPETIGGTSFTVGGVNSPEDIASLRRWSDYSRYNQALKPGPHSYSDTGFLAPHEDLVEVLEQDAATLRALDTSAQDIGRWLRQLTYVGQGAMLALGNGTLAFRDLVPYEGAPLQYPTGLMPRLVGPGVMAEIEGRWLFITVPEQGSPLHPPLPLYSWNDASGPTVFAADPQTGHALSLSRMSVDLVTRWGFFQGPDAVLVPTAGKTNYSGEMMGLTYRIDPGVVQSMRGRAVPEALIRVPTLRMPDDMPLPHGLPATPSLTTDNPALGQRSVDRWFAGRLGSMQDDRLRRLGENVWLGRNRADPGRLWCYQPSLQAYGLEIIDTFDRPSHILSEGQGGFVTHYRDGDGRGELTLGDQRALLARELARRGL
jgi:hypothetical protein